MDTADAAVEKEDWARAAATMEAVIDSPAFEALDGPDQHHALAVAAVSVIAVARRWPNSVSALGETASCA